MRQKKVLEIIVPYQEGTPHLPAITMNDKIIDAVELMVNHGLHQIAVVRNNRPVGMIRLEDAFQKLGLQGPRLKNRMYHSNKEKIS